MIIFGARNAVLKSAIPQESICPKCFQQGTTVVNTLSRHLHIFFIPLFPIRKYGMTICQNCQYIMYPITMSWEIKNQYKLLKKESRIPLWQFSGLAIILFLFLVNRTSNLINTHWNEKYFANPQIGDIYKAKTDDGYRSLIKIWKITNDSIYFKQYKLSYKRELSDEEIDDHAGFNVDLVYSRSLIKKAFDQGVFYDIMRE